MYFRVRKVGDKDLTVFLSRVSSIVNLRRIVKEKLAIEPENQILLYRGKEMSDDYRIVDYGIQLNDVVQLMDRKTFRSDLSGTKSDQIITTNNQSNSSGANPDKHNLRNNKEDEVEVSCKSKYYKKGDRIDFMDKEYGSWLEGIVVDTVRKIKEKGKADNEIQEEDILFKVKMDIGGYPHAPFCLKFNEIRPRACHILSKQELNIGDIVLVNYNDKEPKERGLWYDFLIENLIEGVTGTVMAGNTVFENCTVYFTNEIMRIEKPNLIEDKKNDASIIVKREIIYRCNTCKDIPSKKCNECGCKVCFGKQNITSIILCDDCDSGYHISCLDPPLPCIPLDADWYCPECKTDTDEIVKPGDKLKFSNKKAKKPSNKQDSASKEWGRGMACVGRTKECTIVPIHHFGPIPGVEVGTCWKFRVQVSEAGVHRQSVAGIHGREVDGAYSIVLSGGYEDDVDNGDEFYYTGCGGRDLSGNKRISVQSFDQSLTSMNKALALNCNTKFDDKNGGEAVDWQTGKPVRVVRNYKLAKYSKYAPKEGNRYDGIYKVVKYFPEKGKSGFLVWRYLLRRDDPVPPPWDKDGQQLPMLYPEGYLEALLEKKKQNATSNGRKRKNSFPISNTSEVIYKRARLTPYELDEETGRIIDADKTNENIWTQCKASLKDGKQQFLQAVERVFCCICCFEVVYLPVITPCKHIVCKSCLHRSLSAEIYTCPYCRYELGIKFKLVVAQNLSKALLKLFPGYETGR